jgi:hypothetical protein
MGVTLRAISFTLAVLAGAAVPAAAQSVAMPAPGTAVRVTPPPPARRPVVGTFLMVRGDSLLIQAQGKPDTLSFPLALDRIEVQRGMKRRTGELAGKGALVGLGLGLLYGLVGPESCDEFLCSTREDWPVMTLIAVPAGLVVGALSGMVSEEKRWEPLLKPARRASTGGPGLALGVQVAW